MRGLENTLPGEIDRSAEADANAFHTGSLDPGFFQQFGDASRDLTADAFGAGLNYDFIATIEQDERVVFRVVFRGRVGVDG